MQPGRAQFVNQDALTSLPHSEMRYCSSSDLQLRAAPSTYRLYHRLNGSSSPVLTATSHSYGKAKNSTPHRIETPNLIDMKFGTVDYVGEATPSANFHANPSMGASRKMGEIYTQNFYLYIYIYIYRLYLYSSRKIK